MEKFYFEEPTINRKEDAILYIKEFHEYNSIIHGVSGLDSEYDNYEEWLINLEKRKTGDDKYVPGVAFFLIRESDDKIIGMTSVRLELNDQLRVCGGHIGYSIRPSERRKGYNKINLYLGLKVCDEYGIDEALLDADLDNEGSWKTMEALGGKRIKEYIDPYDGSESVKYSFNIKEVLNKYKDIYEPLVKTCKIYKK